MTVKPHECIHEEMLLGQSRAIERLEAGLEYKKERLDDLKQSNIQMQTTLDEIKECVNKIILTSKNDDDSIKELINKQDNRITALETRNKTLLTVMTIGFTAITTIIGVGAFFLTHLH